MSDLRPTAIAVAVLGFFVGGLGAFGRYMPVVLERPPSDIGAAIAVVNGLDFLLAPVAVAVVGYAAGRRVDVSEAWPRVAAVFAGLGGVAAFVGSLVVTLAVVENLLRTAGIGLVLTVLVSPIVTGISFALTGIALAAVAQFRES